MEPWRSVQTAAHDCETEGSLRSVVRKLSEEASERECEAIRIRIETLRDQIDDGCRELTDMVLAVNDRLDDIARRAANDTCPATAG